MGLTHLIFLKTKGNFTKKNTAIEILYSRKNNVDGRIKYKVEIPHKSKNSNLYQL